MSLSIFLVAYFVFLFIFAIFAFFDIYHLVKFVPVGSSAFFTTYIFLAVAILIIFITLQELQNIDWTQNIFIFNFG